LTLWSLGTSFRFLVFVLAKVEQLKVEHIIGQLKVEQLKVEHIIGQLKVEQLKVEHIVVQSGKRCSGVNVLVFNILDQNEELMRV
jgi:hypothetical protein